jgi:general secretion pathway protein G
MVMPPIAQAHRRRGFTLIELTVVFTIIALLLTIAVPRYFRSIEKTKETVLRSNLLMTRDALDKYFSDTGRYPDTLEELVQKKYLRSLPRDPISDTTTDWILIPPKGEEGAVGDIQSAATGKAIDGTDYHDW